MTEQLTPISDQVTLCHDEFGDPSDPTVLLIMGLGTQMIAWHEEFCQGLVERGLHVVRFDNRDIGRSTHMDFKPPSIARTLARRLPAEQYTLGDMADDTAALIEKLELGPVHVVGASMGGMIAQTLASQRPDLTRTLTSIMSNTGHRLWGQPTLAAMRYFLQPPPEGREATIDQVIGLFRIVGSPPPWRDEDQMRETIGRSWDRDHDPAGTARQLGAIAKSGNRSKALAKIKAPTLVIHGRADKLVLPTGGRATAKAIPDAKLLMIDGMGHDLPRGAWPQIIDAIASNTLRARDAEPHAAATAA